MRGTVVEAPITWHTVAHPISTEDRFLDMLVHLRAEGRRQQTAPRFAFLPSGCEPAMPRLRLWLTDHDRRPGHCRLWGRYYFQKRRLATDWRFLGINFEFHSSADAAAFRAAWLEPEAARAAA